jgi:hypothetical protein
MARILALDWDHREARFVLASSAHGSVRIHAAEVVSLENLGSDDNGGGNESDPEANNAGPAGENLPAEKIGEALRRAFKNLKVARATVLVGVNRQSVELLHLSLPPAKDDELPQLVANQVIKESQMGNAEAVLDFLPTAGDPNGPRLVTAAVLPNEQLGRLQAACAAAGLKPRRMLLRSYASASRFSRTTSPPEDVCLLVNLVGDEVDLTVTVRGQAIFARTVRLPGDADDERATRRLVGEIKRTMAAARQNRPDEGLIEGIYIFGGPGDHAELAALIKAELSISAMVIDPFVGVDLPKSLVPDNSGAFAPLLGMLFDEARGGTHAIDFLHPRRRPEPRSRRRPLIIAAGLLASLALAAGYHVLDQISDADAKNDALRKELSELKQLVKKAKAKEEVVKAVEQWQASGVNWLDELRDMSIRFPSSRDAIVLRMTFARARGGGGAVNYSGLVRDPLIVVRMESSIRDEYHEIRSKRVQERQPDKGYTWRFETAMTIAKRDKDKYVSHLSKPAAEPEAEENEPKASK